jgi:CheY-like chemotaxis protein
MRILIVEDNADCRELLTMVVRKLGYAPIPVDSGEEAITAARMHQPDLILMDIALPGMSGIDAAAAIKASPETARIPVIALSGWAHDGYRKRALQAGMAAYLVKPTPFDGIKSAIQIASAASLENRTKT